MCCPCAYARYSWCGARCLSAAMPLIQATALHSRLLGYLGLQKTHACFYSGSSPIESSLPWRFEHKSDILQIRVCVMIGSAQSRRHTVFSSVIPHPSDSRSLFHVSLALCFVTAIMVSMFWLPRPWPMPLHRRPLWKDGWVRKVFAVSKRQIPRILDSRVST